MISNNAFKILQNGGVIISTELLEHNEKYNWPKNYYHQLISMHSNWPGNTCQFKTNLNYAQIEKLWKDIGKDLHYTNGQKEYN